MRIILHIDMDSFYASVEIAKNPSLKDKPLVIGANPKEGKGRGVAMTCNYPARKFGIRSGMSISMAYKLCPNAAYLPPDMELYVETSFRIMEILRKYADKFEQVSIDEAFLDISEKADNFETEEKIAIAIKKEILEKENLTCSIGIGENKLIAKIASDFKKPDGLTIVLPDNSKKFLEPMAVDKIPGIGPKSKKILDENRIKIIGDIQKSNIAQLSLKFGNNFAGWIYSRANGIDDSPVEEKYEIKSINRNITLEEDTLDINIINDTLNLLAKEVYDAVNSIGILFKTVTLRVRYDNFETYTRAKSLDNFTGKKEHILKVCMELLAGFLGRRKIRQLGIKVSNFQDKNSKQKSILDY